ncbi:hypothetical protein BB560_001441 [Smittium megazygosporum]|uniref:Uncharacterized protein n=1 Tax=Smittium megazygosporum TaxID=133381 RepID=A0A2T9ZHM1_9FUNG|nr:hypothetical protein BB560_001441 [Smittium megazygosporum]
MIKSISSYLLVLYIAVLNCLVQGELLQYPVSSPNISCNGHNLLCDRGFNRVVSLTTRSSFTLADPSKGVIGTQTLTVEDQLKNGVRGLTITLFPTPNDPKSVSTCLGDCSINNGGTLLSALTRIYSWLNQDANLNEIVSIYLDNPNRVDLTLVNDAFIKSKISSMIFVKTTSNTWPTLRQMISSKKRVVVLESDQLGLTPQLSFVAPYTTVVFETAKSVNYTATGFDCGPYGVAPAASLFVINHLNTKPLTINGKQFAFMPDPNLQSVINNDTLALHSMGCMASHGIVWITHTIVDFYSPGILDRITRGFNGLPQPNESYKEYVPNFKKSSSTTSTSKFSISLTLLSISLLLSLFYL